MTEAEWLSCTDPVRMIEHMPEPISERKGRLLMCACCRLIDLQGVSDSMAESLLEVAERYAEFAATGDEFEAARKASRAAEEEHPHMEAVSATLMSRVWGPPTLGHCPLDVFRFLTRYRYRDIWLQISLGHASDSNLPQSFGSAMATSATVLRHLVGNPFRPAHFDTAWRTPDALALATAAYDSRRYHDLPILADALEDAGCSNAEILKHCRNSNEIHFRGCWVVDLVLGKE
jgi:hypothetical protein